LLPHRRELRADGVAVELGSRAFDVLMVLTEARGALVTKDEILSLFWPDTVVEENNLAVLDAAQSARGGSRFHPNGVRPGLPVRRRDPYFRRRK
jgi:hypothetical protein